MGAGAAAAKLSHKRCCIDAQKWWRIGFGVDVVHDAPETLSTSFMLRHHAWMQASAVSQRAACRGSGILSAHRGTNSSNIDQVKDETVQKLEAYEKKLYISKIRSVERTDSQEGP